LALDSSFILHPSSFAHWLELLRDDCGVLGERVDHLLRETDELMAIFTSMVAKLRKSGA